MSELDINFQWVSGAQKLDATAREVKGATVGFARMIVDEVALATSERNYKAARNKLVTDVKNAALIEVNRMAGLIGRTVGLPDNRTGPEGPMSIKLGKSETYQKLNFSDTYYREDSGIVWPKREASYVARKKSEGYPADWWERKGNLAKHLAKGAMYTRAWGSVRVVFHPPRVKRGKGGRFQRQLGGLGRVADVNVTRSGRGGFFSEYEVGRLEVSVFGRITPAMLPSLADMASNSIMRKSKPSGAGISALLPANQKDRIRQKLLHRRGQQRYALEPFVSFYLTRAIPNAIWRRTESLVSSTAGRTR